MQKCSFMREILLHIDWFSGGLLVRYAAYIILMPIGNRREALISFAELILNFPLLNSHIDICWKKYHNKISEPLITRSIVDLVAIIPTVLNAYQISILLSFTLFL